MGGGAQRAAAGAVLQAWDVSNASLGQVIGDGGFTDDVVDVLTTAGYEVDFEYNGDSGNPNYSTTRRRRHVVAGLCT